VRLACYAALAVTNWGFFFAATRLTRPAPSGENFLTGGMEEVWWERWPWMAPIQAALGYLFGRLGGLAPPATFLAVLLVYLVPVGVEVSREPTAHNLIPFELLFHALACVPVAAGVLLARWHARRSARPEGAA
jgi:hypothetical protein